MSIVTAKITKIKNGIDLIELRKGVDSKKIQPWYQQSFVIKTTKPICFKFKIGKVKEISIWFFKDTFYVKSQNFTYIEGKDKRNIFIKNCWSLSDNKVKKVRFFLARERNYLPRIHSGQRSFGYWFPLI